MGNKESTPEQNANARGFFSGLFNRNQTPNPNPQQGTPAPKEKEDWGAFMERNTNMRDHIYTGVNNELQEHDPIKHAEKIKIEEQVLHKTKMHFFVKTGEVTAKVVQDKADPKNLEIWVDIQVRAAAGFDFKKFPSGGLAKVFLFSRQKMTQTEKKFSGFEDGKFYKSFVAYNFQKKVDVTKQEFTEGGTDLLFKGVILQIVIIEILDFEQPTIQ